MSYGFLTANQYGEKVLNAEEPLYVKVREGVLASSGYAGTPRYTTQYFYKFYKTGGAVATGSEIVLYDIGTYNHIAFPPPTDLGNLGEIMYVKPTLRYVVMAPRDVLDNPTGYGAACYNSNGECTWSTNELLCAITGGFVRRQWSGIGQDSIGFGYNPIQPNLVTGSNSSIIIIGNTPSMLGAHILSLMFYDNGDYPHISLSTQRFDKFDFFLPFNITFAQDMNALVGSG